MNIYLYLLLLIILFGLLIKNHNIYIFIACSAMFIVYGLRDGRLFGLDAGSYYSLYVTSSYLSSSSMISTRNIGFSFFTYYMSHLSAGSYQLYVIVISAFVMFSFYRFIKKYSLNPLLSFMWYFGMLYYTLNFTIFKQSIAMAILLYAFDAIMEKDLFKYLILISIATLFHVPAIVFLPAYWLSEIRIGKYYFILVLFALSLTYVFRNQILSFMLSFYSSGETISESPKFIGGKVIYMLLVIFISILLRTPRKEDKLYCTLLIFVGIAVVLQTFCYYNNIFERLADYYYQFSVLLIPLIFSNENRQSGLISLNENSIRFVNIFGKFIIIMFAFWRFYTYININFTPYFLPFKFFWE